MRPHLRGAGSKIYNSQAVAIGNLQVDAFSLCNYRAAMDQLTPDIIRARAYEARISINALMKRANVNNSTFCRWASGETTNLHPVTLGKIADALAAIEAETSQ